ncbi:hypothetical protein PPYR_02917 [Photinus pyralis]|uniref:EDR1/CTR1/ARMC3-like peptidase-like domain-containing protein n=2 Tax=Photinus pyralis TaxID=7054 RepID=A0A5N4A1B6_PHOPY|nr:uncharacterized protein LOC116160934 [Photinus pyralis]KAB0791117.1 hypothetical protein PPYR_02917 [Photinus pyralis]
MAKSKIPPKEAEIPFIPVPYETTDVLTSITLLGSAEKNIVLRALNTLTKFADRKDTNSEYLYKNGAMTKLVDLLEYSDLAILRFTLKLLAQMVTISSEAAEEMSFGSYKSFLGQITFLFVTSQDAFVKEFGAQFLANVSVPAVSSSLLRLGVMAPIFSVLKYSDDLDTQFYTLRLLYNVLEAREAPSVIPNVPEFSAETLLDYLLHSVAEVRSEALNVVEGLALWKSARVQEHFRESRTMERLLQIILQEEYKSMHKKAFAIILISTECPQTVSHLVKTVEFLEFCQWAKSCPKKLIRPAATILAAITKDSSHLQLLFDFSVEDTILSFFRTENEFVHYQVCVAISNLSAHRYCCQKIVTPVVVKCILRILHRLNLPFNPYHEIAYKTILDLLKRNEKTINLVASSDGIHLLLGGLLRKKDNYSSEGLYDQLYILYIFSSNTQYKHLAMSSAIFQVLLQRYAEHSEYSNLSLLVIDQYLEIAEYRHYYLEYLGPAKVIEVITSTPNEILLKNTLVHLKNACVYKNICMEFLWQGILDTLEHFSDEVKEEIPIVNHLIATIYNFYLPLKFERERRLEVTDHLPRRFYVVKGRHGEFPFLEILDRIQACSRNIIYVVDCTADVSHLEIAVQESESVSDLTCKAPSSVNYGCLSEDTYLPQYVHKLRKRIYENKKHVMCFQHQVKTLAEFVNNTLSGPLNASTKTDQHCLEVHLAALREKLGTNLIPIGFLRHGFHCEKSLLFKALADKLGIPCTLCKGKGRNDSIYWNEVPILCNEEYEQLGENVSTYMGYAVVDLMDDIGELMLVGTMKADNYCGIQVDWVNGSQQITLEAILCKV